MASGWKPKTSDRYLFGVAVAGGEVHPQEAVGTVEQISDVCHSVGFEPVVGDHVHVHAASMRHPW